MSSDPIVFVAGVVLATVVGLGFGAIGLMIYFGSRDVPNLTSEDHKVLDLREEEAGKKVPHAPGVLSLLDGFGRFCDAENRIHLSLIRTDLIDLERCLRADGRSEISIRLEIARQVVVGAILPIAWDGAVRTSRRGVAAARRLGARSVRLFTRW